jgi:hypothetical protein
MQFFGYTAPRLIAIVCIALASVSMIVGVMFAVALWPDQAAVDASAPLGEKAPPSLYLPAWTAVFSGVAVAVGWLAAATVFGWMAAMYRRVDQVLGKPATPVGVLPTVFFPQP